MLFTLLGIMFVVVGFVVIWIGVTQNKTAKKTKMDALCIGSFVLVVGIIWVMTMALIILEAHSCADSDIVNNNNEYVLLSASVCLLETNPNYEEKDAIIESINNWNEKVDNGRRYLKSPWTNWLYSKRVIDAMEYIEIPENMIK